MEDLRPKAMTDVERREIEVVLSRLIQLLKKQPLGVVIDCINWIIDIDGIGDESTQAVMVDVIEHSCSASGAARILFADIIPDCALRVKREEQATELTE